MQRYSNTITTAAGRAIVGAQITVKTPSGALAAIYADDGITTKANPLKSGVAGYFEFYAAPGAYSLTISGAGITANVVGVTLTAPVTPPTPDISPLAAATGASLVGFQQAGAGSVARTVQDKLRDVVSVKDFGAKGDGTTDDTAAIQAALNASQGQVVVLPPGTYKVTATLTIPTNTILRGTGMVQCILQAAVGFVGTVVVTYGDVDPAYTFASQLRDLTVDANDIAGLSCVDIYRAQESCGIFDCLLKRFRAYGVTCQAGAPANIELAHLWVWASALGATACVNLSGINTFTLRNSTLLSLNATGLANCETGLALLNCSGSVQGIHFENVTNGVKLDGNSNCIDFAGLSGQTSGGIPLTYLVYYAGGALASTFRSLSKGNAVHAFFSARGGLSSDAGYIGYLDGYGVEVGAASSAVTTNPQQYTNTTMRPQVLYIIGGTITSITVVAIAGNSISVSLPVSTPVVVLGPAQRCTIAYSVAPTLTTYSL